MRVVVDTNVLISAFIATGKSHRVLEHCVLHHTVVLSQFILEELREKLIAKFHYASEAADEVVGLLQSKIKLVVPVALPSPVCRDSDDDILLATALAGGCERIITGDKDLLSLRQYNKIAVVSPSDFAQQEAVS
ncbi:MAG TPA: putative toxin-antitoxin system toxin component, PIN family [Gemmataceae bacterium]|nr:putative toxin-antitoxin system toxin component, PIN family [Gemmataceae bacterium]